MVEQTQILVNRNVLNYLTIIIIASICYSCKDYPSLNKNPVKSYKKAKNINKSDSLEFSFNKKIDSFKQIQLNVKEKKEFNCDSLDIVVNDSSILNHAENFIAAFPNIKEAWSLNDRVYILSSDLTQYISFGVAYGGRIHEYRDLRVTKIDSDNAIQKYVPKEVKKFIQLNNPESQNYKQFYFIDSRFSNFVSGKGIKLDMSMQDLESRIMLKSFNKLVLNKDSIVYNYKNDYCMYYEKYIVVNNQLIDFSYGFETP